MTLLILVAPGSLAVFEVHQGKIVFDGDMVMTPTRASKVFFRSGRVDEEFLWPNGKVFYVLDKTVRPPAKKVIRSVLANIQRRICITFEEVEQKKANVNHLKFKSDEMGCWSHVGYQNILEQIVNLNSNCFSKIGVIYHEIFHTLGLFHMQNSSNRDKFVKILWENIKNETKTNFEKYDATISSDFGVPYDYGSVMHYATNAFSANGLKTIEILKKTKKLVGQRSKPSPEDYQRLNNMYKCGKEVRKGVKDVKGKCSQRMDTADSEAAEMVPRAIDAKDNFNPLIDEMQTLKGDDVETKRTTKFLRILLKPLEKILQSKSTMNEWNSV
ncbi:seminal metalloprotease 1-like [Phlebotomus argentipes]|uniref:seminal metalloprotease 1-like n=1 Tax=Phlebotomus argentipes TaxID=94469 RepID=UPI00289332D3|nr:seminal metalloprotease 1-like [Phlebotomus argentipes]